MQVITEQITTRLPLEIVVEDNAPHVYKWTTDEYYQMAEIGFFEGKRVELIGGEIIEMPAMNVAHATTLSLADNAVRSIFSEGFTIRVQAPLHFDDGQEPEPDIAVVVGDARDYRKTHPTTAVLVIEIADTSLNYDRTTKASLYAKQGIEDYWIINLKHRRLEIYRRPQTDDAAAFGFSYANSLFFNEKDFASSLARLDIQIRVADLLP